MKNMMASWINLLKLGNFLIAGKGEKQEKYCWIVTVPLCTVFSNIVFCKNDG